MMKIGLINKTNDEQSYQLKCKFKDECGFACLDLPTSETIDLIVCFGGDGTTLRAVEHAIAHDVPIISVNMGNVGFLCSYQPSELNRLYDDIRNNNIQLEKKVLLKATIGNTEFFALNEIIVQRNCGNISETSDFELLIDGKIADAYTADGIIISTPTGSTAYSLSAGGAILVPELKGFIAGAICPHSLHNRPIVFSDDSVARIKISASRPPCLIYADGILKATINENEYIDIQKATKHVNFAKGQNFFIRLNDKLRKWSK